MDLVPERVGQEFGGHGKPPCKASEILGQEDFLGFEIASKKEFKYRYTRSSGLHRVRESALHLATDLGNRDLARSLLRWKTNPLWKNKNGETAISLAIRRDDIDMLQALLESCPIVSTGDIRAIIVSLKNHNEIGITRSAIPFLLQCRTSHQMCRSLLTTALRDDDMATINCLLANGLDIDTTDEKGMTLLHQAVDQGRKQMIRLLDLGAGLEVKDGAGLTPLHHAACIGGQATKLLLDRGARVNARDNDGLTPLHYAVGGVADELDTLVSELEVTVRIGEVTVDKRSLKAKRRASVGARIVKTLLAHGADVDAVAADGSTALMMANSEEIRAMLQRIGDQSKS